MIKKLKCVMLIDDNEDDNYFHQIALRESDVTEKMEVMLSGFEALDYLRKNETSPDLILLDINMPKMNGWEFLAEYRKLPSDKKAKTIIIMLSTSLNPEDQERAAKISEISGYETKPLTVEMLFDIMKTYFEDFTVG